ncbi:MAG: HAMP domain-containing sensor histidine kinase [bacterium]
MVNVLKTRDEKKNLDSLKMVAHDLRNPIISIRAFSQLILENSKNLEDENKEFLEIISQVSKNLLDLTEKFLEETETPQKKNKLTKQKVNFSTLVNERTKIYKPQADQKNIKIYESYSNVPFLNIDKEKIARVIDNLISNAIKYSFKDTNIFINVFNEGGFVNFVIKDGGSGILLSDQPKLFKKNSKLKNKPTNGEKSHGLGLSIAKQLIEEHYGKIYYQNSEEKGSQFIFKLPIVNNLESIEVQDANFALPQLGNFPIQTSV